MNHIRYIQHNDIDKQKWDSCIEIAGNSLIYGYTWWLDTISPGWHALVLNDYEAVMPLTWRKKYGIYYLYQPFCTAALGMFYKPRINVAAQDFFYAIPTMYKYWDIDVNDCNQVADKSINAFERVNQMLALEGNYDEVRKGYSRLAKRKLNKAGANNLVLVTGCEPKIIIDLYRKEYHNQHSAGLEEYGALTRCCDVALGKNMAETYLAQSSAGDIVSFYITLKDDNFVYSLLGGSAAIGKQTGGFYFLTDAAIRSNCKLNKTFRFEGSDNKGIHFFNNQFGAYSKTYLHIQHNKLPFPFSVFKKRVPRK